MLQDSAKATQDRPEKLQEAIEGAKTMPCCSFLGPFGLSWPAFAGLLAIFDPPPPSGIPWAEMLQAAKWFKIGPRGAQGTKNGSKWSKGPKELRAPPSAPPPQGNPVVVSAQPFSLEKLPFPHPSPNGYPVVFATGALLLPKIRMRIRIQRKDLPKVGSADRGPKHSQGP